MHIWSLSQCCKFSHSVHCLSNFLIINIKEPHLQAHGTSGWCSPSCVSDSTWFRGFSLLFISFIPPLRPFLIPPHDPLPQKHKMFYLHKEMVVWLCVLGGMIPLCWSLEILTDNDSRTRLATLTKQGDQTYTKKL